MGARLKSSVVVRHPELGVKILAAGSVLPKWAKGRVSDRLLETSRSRAADQDPPEEPDEPSGDPGEVDDDDADGGAPAVEAPPRAGRGSGLEAWTVYVEGLGLEIPDGASRDDLIELVDEHHDES